ncbi:outer membrane protein [Microvirga alba]|uniref:Porin family protein n=1 Tax=Microvirga alba TaxID=2791025 RepID=A0A931FMP2_9HYPH|nr:outer membrane beta-barrel protein [Microvirga alba]MBF9233269.1 porin family protein [Microvirga alba]
MLSAGILAFTAVGGSALAADVASPAANPIFDPTPLWSGFHLGINAGGGFSKATSDFRYNHGPVFGAVPNRFSGLIGGIGAGYDWQAGAIVLGAETDFQLAGGHGRKAATCPTGFCGAAIDASYTQDLSWFGTVRGRLGYSAGNWLAYVTGGYAYARLETKAVAVAPIGAASASWNELKNGWVLGGGVEVMLAPGWSAKIEGLHLGFGETTKTWSPAAATTITETSHLKTNLVRGGVNYHF